jgi:hypothetical protein
VLGNREKTDAQLNESIARDSTDRNIHGD